MTYWKAVIEALLSLREKVTTFSSACLQLYVQPWCCSRIVNRNHSCPVWICDSSLQWILQRLSDKRFSGVRRIVSRLRKQSYLRTTSILISKLVSKLRCNRVSTPVVILSSYWAPAAPNEVNSGSTFCFSMQHFNVARSVSQCLVAPLIFTAATHKTYQTSAGYISSSLMWAWTDICLWLFITPECNAGGIIRQNKRQQFIKPLMRKWIGQQAVDKHKSYKPTA